MTTEFPLAVIGMACRLPGANNLDEFWQLLVTGGSAISDYPPERLDQILYYDPRKGIRGKTYSKKGALPEYPSLDRKLYPLPDEIVRASDSGHLAIFQVAVDACRHAKLDPFNLPSRNVGVYLGHTASGQTGPDLTFTSCIEQTIQYLREIDDFKRLSKHQADAIIKEIVETARGSLLRRALDGSPIVEPHMGSFIISKAFGLNGPSIVLDAACASSLQALAIASRSLRLGRIEMAIVGGASFCNTDSLVLFSQAQSVSSTCSCPFDAQADGLVGGEGFVALVVKALDRAIADGDPIHAVISGIGIASDGRGKSLWAPRKEGQIEAIRRAYSGGLDIGRLQYIEAHATSTKVGDATELAALAGALKGRLPKDAKIPIGSVKANIGHTLETAGVAGFVKTVMAMHQGIIPRQINLNQLSPQVDWEKMPFFVPTENIQWPVHADGHPRRAAVNAFGIGGLNVHVVVDEFHKPAPVAVPVSMPAIACSAETPDTNSVAIIGMGCVFPGARTLEAFWDLLASGRDPKCEVPDNRWDGKLLFDAGSGRSGRGPTNMGGFITDFEYDWRRHKIPPLQISRANPLQFMILDAADAAFRDAGYDKKPYDNRHVGVVVGTMFEDEFYDELRMGLRLPEIRLTIGNVLRRRGVPENNIEPISEAFAKIVLERMPAMLDDTGSFTPSTLASRITKTFDLMGGAMTLDVGHCSSLAALGCSVDLLLSNTCDMVVCAGGQRSMGLRTYEKMNNLGCLTAKTAKSPFDADADGCVPGEGVGVVILKRLTDARRDGDQVHGIIRSVGISFGDVRSQATHLAARRAFEIAGVKPNEIALLEMSSNCTQNEGKAEVQSLVDIFAGEKPISPVMLDSVAPQIGHTQGASGMASLIKAALAIEHCMVPGAFGLDRPDRIIAAHSDNVQVARKASSLTANNLDGRVLAGVTGSAGIGSVYGSAGPAYHVVIERGSKVPLPATSGAVDTAKQPTAKWRIVRFGGESLEHVVESLKQVQQRADAIFAAALSSGFTAVERFRVAIVTENPTDLAQKAKLAVEYLGRPDAARILEQKGVFFGDAVRPRPAIAFLFPGQGSQYSGMLRHLIEEFPPAAEAARRIDAVLGKLGFPDFADVAWKHGDALGSDVWRTQMSMLMADTVMYASLDAIGIRPDYVSGHSFGEFPALIAAGAWNFEAAARATDARCKAILACTQAKGKMLCTSAGAAVLEKACREMSGQVYIANCNAPDQTVVGGIEESVDRLADWLRENKFAARELAVPRPFHTPLMKDVQSLLAQGLAGISFSPPKTPILSSVTNRYVAEPADMRNNLVTQLTQPVRYVELINRLSDEGIHAFVEVGPGQVLTRLHRRILAGRKNITIASDHPQKNGLRQLLCVRACLETIGALDAETEDRAMLAIEPGAGAVQSASTPPSLQKARHNHSTLPADRTSKTTAGSSFLRTSNNSYAIGLQYGRDNVTQIRSILRINADIAGYGEDGFSDIEIAASQPELIFGPEQLEEMRGIADGAEVSTESILAHNLRLSMNSAIEEAPRRQSPILAREMRRRNVVSTPSSAPKIFMTKEAYAAAWAKPRIEPSGKLPQQLCDRFVLRMVDVGLPDSNGKPLVFNGPSLIVGRNALSKALRKEIEKQGGAAIELPLSENLEETLAKVDEIWKVAPTPHLFLLTAHDDDAVTALDEMNWNRRRDRGVMLPYFVCQRWFQLIAEGKLIDKSSVVAGVDLGGDFGISGRMRNVEGGALAGLIKGLRLEVYQRNNRGFQAKIVDKSPNQSTEEFARAMLRELSLGDDEVEICSSGKNRFVTRGVWEPGEDLPDAEQPPSGTWVVTGGARGITALNALELGRKFGLKLHLIGASPLPIVEDHWRNLSAEQMQKLRAATMKESVKRGEVPVNAWKKVEKAIEIDKNLRAFRDAGVAATYHCCNVGDRAAMSALLDLIRLQDGPISGIMHGAGVERSSRFEKKNREFVLQTVAAKLDGAAILMDLTRNDPLKHFIAFGSLAGRIGGIGQTDYSMANDMLGKLLCWYRTERPECRAITFQWHSWDEVGMAARSESTLLLEMINLQLMPTSEGINHLLQELRIGVPESEIIITERKFLSNQGAKALPGVSAATKTTTSPNKSPSVQPDINNIVSQAAPLNGDKAEQVGSVAKRYVMRTVESQLDRTGKHHQLAGQAIVLGENIDANALCSHLRRIGVKVHQLTAKQSANHFLTELERIWANEPVTHLFIMSGRDAEAGKIDDRQIWLRRREAGIIVPWLVCQRWLQLLFSSEKVQKATLTIVTSLGGDFGFTERVVAPEGGALAGMLKAIRAETKIQKWDGLRMRVIDAPVNEPPDGLAAAIVCELSSDANEVEVAYSGGKRHLVQMISQPVAELPHNNIPQGGTWIVVGGARGITAATAMELGLRCGVKLHLLGKSPQPNLPEGRRNLSPEQITQLKRSLMRQALAEGKSPSSLWGRVQKDIEIDKNLRAMAKAGIKATYHCCDVSDWDHVAKTLDRIRKIDGPIEGIINGGGILYEGVPFTKKSQQKMIGQIGVKIDATLALMCLTHQDPLKYFLGFGSISGRLGTSATSDYALGCEMLCKLMGWFRHQRPECRSIGFHWHAWGEVGMMNDPINFGASNIMKMKLMSPTEGTRRLIDELCAGAPESEVLITDPDYLNSSFPCERIVTSVQQVAPQKHSGDEMCLLNSVKEYTPGRHLAAEVICNPTVDQFLLQHRFRGKPIMPVVVVLEALIEAATLLADKKRMITGLRNVEIINPLRFHTDSPQTILALADASHEGIICQLTSHFFNRRGQMIQKDRQHFRVLAEAGPNSPLDNAPTFRLPDDWISIKYPEDDLVLYHGPVFRRLTHMASGSNGTSYGKIVAASSTKLSGDGRQGDFILPAAELDACLFACGAHLWMRDHKSISIPQAFDYIQLGRAARPGEECIVLIRLRSEEKNIGVFDFVLIGDDKSVILNVEGYRNFNVMGERT
jgi:acyl transferase domain-containing protein/NAD(P)-dependent dehydrogenase (short-subunit alcohol dehydrogenase family)/3-hydroxymyristoyl/3-hydroxydecanoyl-(acyl carrier protein) dehydratase